jgi:hypothetical protein
VKVVGVGSDLPEVALIFPALKKSICTALNRGLGLADEPSYSLAGEQSYGFRLDPTVDLSANDTWTFGDDFPDLIGKTSFCAGNATTGYYFYHIVVPR